MHRIRMMRRVGVIALVVGCSGCGGVTLVEIAGGFDIITHARPGLSETGTVVAAEPQRLLVGNGGVLDAIDLAPSGLTINPLIGRRPIQVRSAGDIVFVSDRDDPGCLMNFARGAYSTDVLGAPLATLHETCPAEPMVGAVARSIAMSPNGTVAFSDIRNGFGALYRGPVAGPFDVLRSGTSEFFNVYNLDANDGGRVTAQMEYFDGFAGGLMRAIFAFDVPEQTKEDSDTAIEKLGIGQAPAQAINAGGTVAFSINSDMSFPIDGVDYMFDAGVYVATPTQFNTPKSLTLVADLAGDFCSFGAVDINDAGELAFEASVNAGAGCGGPSTNDGLYSGPDPVADVIIERGAAELEDHQFFDDIRLGEMNNGGQVSFITSYSEPLVDAVKVWRFDP